MNTDETGLLHAIYDEPFDVVPRRVYADWLEEHGATGLAALQRMWMPDGSHRELPEWQRLCEQVHAAVDVDCPPCASGGLYIHPNLHATLYGDWPLDSVAALDDLHRWMNRHRIQALICPQHQQNFSILFSHGLAQDLRQWYPQQVCLSSLVTHRSRECHFEGLIELWLEWNRLPISHLVELVELGDFPQLRGLFLPSSRASPHEMHRLFRNATIQRLTFLGWNIRRSVDWDFSDLLNLGPLPRVRTLHIHDRGQTGKGINACEITEQLVPNIRSLLLLGPSFQTMEQLAKSLIVGQLQELTIESLLELDEFYLRIAERLGPHCRLNLPFGRVSPATRHRLSAMLGPRFRHETYP